MKTAIFYYTGTGNSLWVARTLGKFAGEAEIVSISDWEKEKKPLSAERIGIVFPVHMWGVPAAVIEFISEIKAFSPRYLFALAVNAGQVSNTLVQLKNICRKNGLTLAAGWEIIMPSNYIPWGGAESEEEQKLKFEAAGRKLSGIAPAINNMSSSPVEKGPLWQRILFTALYKLSFPQVPKLDRDFWVDEKCNQCDICCKVCPADNITIVDGKPVWQHHCEQCFACMQWCPKLAIQYGKKTSAYTRYHHPEVQLKDILKAKRL